MKKWIWRAWSKDRERLCDSGWVRGDSHYRAHVNTLMCVGGPYLSEIDDIEVEELPED